MLGKISLLLPQGQWRKLFINVASLFSVQFANMLLPLITVPYVSRIIGPERLGLLSLSLSYNSYFTMLVDFGFNLSVVRLIAANRENKLYISKLFSEVITAKALLLFLSIIIFLTLSTVSSFFRQHLWLHVFTCSYCFGSVLYPQWIYQGMEDLNKLALFNFIARVLMLFGTFILVNKPEKFLYQNLIMSLVHLCVSIFALYKAVNRYKLFYKRPRFQELLVRFKEANTIFVSTVMATLYSSSHVFILGLLSTSYAVGVFSAASRLEAIARTFFSIALNQALLPVIANAFSKSKIKGVVLVSKIFPIIILLTFMIACFLLIFAPFLVRLLYGSQFDSAITVLRIISVIPMLVGINNLFGIYIMLNLRMDKPYFIITTCGYILGMVINFIFIDGYDYIGAAIAWVISEVCIVTTMFLYLNRKGIVLFSVNKNKLIYN